jgi:hypothetical protein
MYHRIPDFPLSFLEIRPPLVVSPWPSMVVLPHGFSPVLHHGGTPSWFFPGLPWWYSPRGFSLALHGGTPLVVSPWPSVVVLPSWFLSGPPWWYSCRGFSLALRDGTTYLALFVISGWPFLVLAGRSSWSLPGSSS